MKWVRQVFFGSLLFFIGAVLVTAGLRWIAKGDAAKVDVALLLEPLPPAEGDSGFAALALIDHEVPVEQLDAVMADEVARFEAFERMNREAMLSTARSSPHSAVDAGLAYRVLEDSRYSRRADIELTPTTCRLAPDDCLAQVRDNADEVRKLLVQAGPRTELAAQALASGHLRSPYPDSIAAPLPAFQSLRLPLTAAALDAVEGRVPEAMSRTCGILGDARRHGASSTHLISKMVMGALAQGAADLLLDIRRSAPDTPLPADCVSALAQAVHGEDYLICEAMRGEFRMVSRVGHELDAALAAKRNPRDLFLRLVAFDADTQDAWTAPGYADTCRDEYRQQVLAGTVPVSRGRELGMSDPTCWGAVVSCILSGAGVMDAGQYQRRMLDDAATLRLQLAVLSVLDGRLAPDAAAAAASSPGYPVLASASGDELAITLKQPRPNQEPSFRIAF